MALQCIVGPDLEVMELGALLEGGPCNWQRAGSGTLRSPVVLSFHGTSWDAPVTAFLLRGQPTSN